MKRPLVPKTLINKLEDEGLHASLPHNFGGYILVSSTSCFFLILYVFGNTKDRLPNICRIKRHTPASIELHGPENSEGLEFSAGWLASIAVCTLGSLVTEPPGLVSGHACFHPAGGVLLSKMKWHPSIFYPHLTLHQRGLEI